MLKRLTLAAALFAGPAAAADYVVIAQELAVNAPADAVWKRVGADYCGLGEWLKAKCVITSGGQEVGAVRKIADRIEEVLVAKTARSYTYIQPKSPIEYHGTLAVEPTGANTSKIVYTLFYDADALPNATPESKAADKERRAKTFMTAMQTMKTLAEAK